MAFKVKVFVTIFIDKISEYYFMGSTVIPQPAITCSKLTIQYVKYVES